MFNYARTNISIQHFCRGHNWEIPGMIRMTTDTILFPSDVMYENTIYVLEVIFFTGVTHFCPEALKSNYVQRQKCINSLGFGG